jgi:hypothetical protein
MYTILATEIRASLEALSACADAIVERGIVPRA